MNLAQLKAFEALARFGNFSRAAEALNVTQPAITTQLKTLQESYGVSLFRRQGYTIKLSTLGHELLPRAKQAIHLITELDRLLAGTDPSNPADSLTIAMYEVNNQSWLSWTTIEGGIYQLQQTSSLNEWQNVGAPRFGADSHDAVQIQNDTDLSIYRIVRLK